MHSKADLNASAAFSFRIKYLGQRCGTLAKGQLRSMPLVPIGPWTSEFCFLSEEVSHVHFSGKTSRAIFEAPWLRILSSNFTQAVPSKDIDK